MGQATTGCGGLKRDVTTNLADRGGLGDGRNGSSAGSFRIKGI
jgi:hypothetical protein